jgi:phytoene synthase
MVLPRTDGPTRAMLVDAYARCREINRCYGRSYYLATRLLPMHKRPHVHALYGFTRCTDEIVDEDNGAPARERAGRLQTWSAAFYAGLNGAPVTDPVLPAVVHTIRTYGLDLEDFGRFLRSMATDLTVTSYPTYDDLLHYMDGSAAAIGTMMLPILGLASGGDPAVARESARQLGLAFQLTNFIRDVGEDLARGRIYLPEEDLAAFGVTRRSLARDAARRQTSPPVRALIEYECGRALGHYAAALPGVAMLEPRSRVCVRTAYLLYGGILDEIGRIGFDVLGQRARVPRRRRAAIVAAASSEGLVEACRRWWQVGLPQRA